MNTKIGLDGVILHKSISETREHTKITYLPRLTRLFIEIAGFPPTIIAVSQERRPLPRTHSRYARNRACQLTSSPSLQRDEPMRSVMAICSSTARIGPSLSLGLARIAAQPPRVRIAPTAYRWISRQSVRAPRTC